MTLEALIVEVALNGEHRAPCTVDDIVESAVSCVSAGASVVHFHVHPAADVGATAAYREAATRLHRELPDVLWYPPLMPAPSGSLAQRVAHVRRLADLGLVQLMPIEPGSATLAWESSPSPIHGADNTIVNNVADIDWLLSFCRAYRLSPQLSIFEPGFLRLALQFQRAGRLPRGTCFKLIFGGPEAAFGMPPCERSLALYLDLLDDAAANWTVSTIGGDVMEDVGPLAITLGGHIRVGLESNPTSSRTNAELIVEVVQAATRLGRPVADCEQARQILGIASVTAVG